MPNGDEYYKKGTLEVLKVLLEAAGPIGTKKRVSGYGINESEFDNKIDGVRKYPGCSRKIFKTRLINEDLIKRRLVTKIITKNKKSNFYGITPLGISFLCERLPELDEYQINRIFFILRFYYSSVGMPYNISRDLKEIDEEIKLRQKKKITKKKLSKLLESKKTLENLFAKTDFDNVWHSIKSKTDLQTMIAVTHSTFNQIKIEERNQNYFVTAFDELTDHLTINFWTYIITEEFHDDCDIHAFNQSMKDSEGMPLPIEDKVFFHEISEFILRAFCYNILNHKPGIFVDDKGVCEIARSYNETIKFLTEHHMKIINGIEKITDPNLSIEKKWVKAPKVEDVIR